MNEQLFHAKSYAEMIVIVEKYVKGLILKSRKRTHSVDKIATLMLSDTHGKIDWFLNQACLSQRQFDRIFKERMGVAPKAYIRLIRFDRAFRMKNRYPTTDWASIALYAGYYDYQHMVKDYKAFTGFTPIDFTKIEEKAPERQFGCVER